MKLNSLENYLSEIGSIQTKKDASLKDYTTVRTGGEARYLIEPDSYESLGKLFNYVIKNNVSFQIMGNGSNLLISDQGYEGIVFSLKNLPSHICFDEGILRVSTNLDSAYLSKKCILEGLSNLEFISGIPGTVGGLVAMNAGAFGNEIGSYISSIKVINRIGKQVLIDKDEINFGYRNLQLREKHFIIIEASFFMHQKTMQEVKLTCDGYIEQRKSKDLWQKNTFGSTFKNGKNYYAGELIEKCGLKGFRIGGAIISQEHANFIINDNNASSKDIYQLILKMREEVKKKFSVDLELEVHMWGDFSYAK